MNWRKVHFSSFHVFVRPTVSSSPDPWNAWNHFKLDELLRWPQNFTDPAIYPAGGQGQSRIRRMARPMASHSPDPWWSLQFSTILKRSTTRWNLLNYFQFHIKNEMKKVRNDELKSSFSTWNASVQSSNKAELKFILEVQGCEMNFSVSVLFTNLSPKPF